MSEPLRFTITGRLPALNDYVSACRSNPHVGAKMKKDAELYLRPFLPRPIDLSYPVDLHITWYEKDARRDPDNVNFSVKFILDSLTTAGVLPGDGRKHVRRIHHDVRTDKDRPRIEVEVRGRE